MFTIPQIGPCLLANETNLEADSASSRLALMVNADPPNSSMVSTSSSASLLEVSRSSQAQTNRPSYTLGPTCNEYDPLGHELPKTTSDITSCIRTQERIGVAEWLMSVRHPTV